jgi:hypothetical protein
VDEQIFYLEIEEQVLCSQRDPRTEHYRFLSSLIQSMDGPTVVPRYSRAYPTFFGKILIVFRGICMYNIVKVLKLCFFAILWL